MWYTVTVSGWDIGCSSWWQPLLYGSGDGILTLNLTETDGNGDDDLNCYRGIGVGDGTLEGYNVLYDDSIIVLKIMKKRFWSVDAVLWEFGGSSSIFAT